MSDLQRAPTNPIELADHLVDVHWQSAEFVDQLHADDMREYHAACHRGGLNDHDHGQLGEAVVMFIAVVLAIVVVLLFGVNVRHEPRVDLAPPVTATRPVVVVLP